MLLPSSTPPPSTNGAERLCVCVSAARASPSGTCPHRAFPAVRRVTGVLVFLFPPEPEGFLRVPETGRGQSHSPRMVFSFSQQRLFGNLPFLVQRKISSSVCPSTRRVAGFKIWIKRLFSRVLLWQVYPRRGHEVHAEFVGARGTRRGSKGTPRHAGSRRPPRLPPARLSPARSPRPFVEKEGGRLDVRAFLSGPVPPVRPSVCPCAHGPSRRSPHLRALPGPRPVLWPLPSPSDFQNQLVRVHEAPTRCVRPSPAAGPSGKIESRRVGASRPPVGAREPVPLPLCAPRQGLPRDVPPNTISWLPHAVSPSSPGFWLRGPNDALAPSPLLSSLFPAGDPRLAADVHPTPAAAWSERRDRRGRPGQRSSRTEPRRLARDPRDQLPGRRARGAADQGPGGTQGVWGA